jgi:hypothetical protein
MPGPESAPTATLPSKTSLGLFVLMIIARGGVGDPVIRRAVDGRNSLVAYDKRSNIAPRFVDVFLDVID